jgi:hypothetical protein
VVGDVETGDMFPWELPAWVLQRRAAGIDPTGYVNLSNWNATKTEFALRGIPEPHWWLALYDNVPVLYPGTIAKQYANAVLTGGHYDCSVVADYWPGVDKMTTDDENALILRIYTLIENLPTCPDLGPQYPRGVVGEVNKLKVQLDAIQAQLDALKPIVPLTNINLTGKLS